MHVQQMLVAGVVLGIAATSNAADRETRVFELRTYTAAPGKFDAMQARFREHALQLFAKHGITSVGYWVPIENPDNQLVYLLAFPSSEAREQSWKAFFADPEWHAVRDRTEANGKLVTKVDSVVLAATDYSPVVTSQPAGERVFELRTYTATPGKLENLNARFRDHTVKLFEKHGMTNVGYWCPSEGQPGAGETLIYLLAHRSTEAAKASFDAFRQDPLWTKARTDSESNAGGPLTVPGGVKSLFLKATDYSPLR